MEEEVEWPRPNSTGGSNRVGEFFSGLSPLLKDQIQGIQLFLCLIHHNKTSITVSLVKNLLGQ